MQLVAVDSFQPTRAPYLSLNDGGVVVVTGGTFSTLFVGHKTLSAIL